MSCLPFMMMLGLNQGDNIVTQQEDLGDKNKEERGVPTQFFFLTCMRCTYLCRP